MTARLDRLLDAATRRLADAGLDQPRLEARALAGGVLDLSRESMLADPAQAVEPAARSRFEAAIARRAAREPMARIIGIREFWSLEFALSPETLIPRPETETVVEAVLERAPRETRLTILDLGTGSGCLLLALLSELPLATGLGVDISAGALATVRQNARRLGLAGRARFAAADWGRGLKGPFDVIVANPPYVAEDARGELAPEVRDHEPARALFAGADGLAAYRELAPDIARLLAPDGLAVVEIGAGQGHAVAAVFADAGLAPRGSRDDLAGHRRALVFAHGPGTEGRWGAKKKVGKRPAPV